MDEHITELSARIAALERRLAETERSRRGLRPPAFVRRLLPVETRAHLREARRHVWLAVRAMVDARIEDGVAERADRGETREPPASA